MAWHSHTPILIVPLFKMARAWKQHIKFLDPSFFSLRETKGGIIFCYLFYTSGHSFLLYSPENCLCCSLIHSWPTICNPMDCSSPRLPCPSRSPGACSNSYPLSQWCHPITSSSIILFSSCLLSFPASGSFQWVGTLHHVAKLLELQPQHESLQWIFGIDFL